MRYIGSDESGIARGDFLFALAQLHLANAIDHKNDFLIFMGMGRMTADFWIE